MTSQQIYDEFTAAARADHGLTTPMRPNLEQPMTIDQIKQICKMVLSECTELIQTCAPKAEDALTILKECIGTDVTDSSPCSSPTQAFAEQMDAFVDIIYYLQDCACKKGVNLDNLLQVVHASNVQKRWQDGKYHLRSTDLKVMKPANFQDPDIEKALRIQNEQGAFDEEKFNIKKRKRTSASEP